VAGLGKYAAGGGGGGSNSGGGRGGGAAKVGVHGQGLGKKGKG
jgi:hypothetical protein